VNPKTRASDLVALVVILLVCPIPVALLYWLFGSQNYFELKKGIGT